MKTREELNQEELEYFGLADLKRTPKEELRVLALMKKFQMQKLSQNGHKKHWLEEDLMSLVKGMMNEVEEFKREIYSMSYSKADFIIDKAILECADVANYLAFIIDKLRVIKEKNNGNN